MAGVTDKPFRLLCKQLGAGLAVFAGPAIVGIFIGSLGSTGVVWILAGLYFLSALLTWFINLPARTTTEVVPEDELVLEPVAGTSN